MTIPNKYQTSSNQIINYDFTDIASGVGYVTLNLFRSHNTVENASDQFHLSDLTVFSDTTTSTSSSLLEQQDGEQFFDTQSFKRSLLMDGNLIIDLDAFRKDGSTWQASGSIILQTGGVDTIIKEWTAATYTGGTGQNNFHRTILVPISQTKIKVNDILRLQISLANSSNAGDAIFLDPTGVNASSQGSSKIHIPLKIGL